jgi:hypothetical protein
VLGDATSATSYVSGAATLKSLATTNPDPTATTTGVQAVTGCTTGYAPPSSLTSSTPASLPTAGGVFYTATELAVWRQRVKDGGPFVKDGDYTTGSPGDWNRITANGKILMAAGEETVSSSTNLSTHGTLARDAAFYQLITADGVMTSAVKKYLLAQISSANLDLSTKLCFRETSGSSQDGWFFQSSWLLRYIATYDFIRSSFTSAERLSIENFIRKNAYFLAAHTDWGLSNIFPSRLKGSYSVVASSAATKTVATTFMSKQFDTNVDCTVDTKDQTTTYVTNAYIAPNAVLGPQLSVLSQWYNNRRSLAATAFGTAGVLLGDANLIASSKRYFMEWLTYSVWEDGSQGEYFRNGDYCIAGQGFIYAASNEQGAAMIARILARQGDRSMADFSTTAGLFGSQSSITSKPKSLELVISTRMNLMNGDLKWYYYRPWTTASSSDYDSSYRIGAVQNLYMGTGKGIDEYHELGLMQAASMYTSSQSLISNSILRKNSVRFPGSTGNSVSTGYGYWTDAFNTLPAILLLRP